MKEIQNWPGYFVCEDGRIWSEKSKKFSKDDILINSYTSEAEASRSSGISRQGINNCVNDKTKSSGGYIWKRLEDKE